MAKKSSDQKERDFLDTAMKRLKVSADADDHNRTMAIEDLQFANNEQWTLAERKRRSDRDRPCLTINMLPKYIRQVVGDLLHNTPSIKFIPADSQADANLALIRQGIVSSIQYNSDAESIYDYATNMFVTCGYGAWRVLTQYTDDNPFTQEIRLELIRNPFLVYLDPTAKSKSGIDAKWGFVLEKLSKKDFEEKYPDAKYSAADTMQVGKGLASELWYDKDTITVAEYFEIKPAKEIMILLEDGRVVTEHEFTEIKEKWEQQHKDLLKKIGSELSAPPSQPTGPNQQAPGAAAPASPQTGLLLSAQVDKLGPEPKEAKRRVVENPVIKHWVMTAAEILAGDLEGETVAGKYIPLVLLKGPELNIEGKNFVYSLIRHAKDPQKLLNYWNSSAAEVIALAPKAPFMATPKQVEGHEKSYATVNIDNTPLLLYNVDPDAPGPPIRMAPGPPPSAIFEQISRAEENMKSVIGMFNADVGASGSEQTGAAITARQRPGDIGTYMFAKNLVVAVTHTGKIINEMIPTVYDTEQDIQVRKVDESESFVPVNTTVGEAIRRIGQNPSRYGGLSLDRLKELAIKEGRDAKYNDITTGKFGVRVTTGPSYATQRQDSAHLLLQLVQAMPQQMSIASDIIIENLDFKDSEELASRLRKPLVNQGITKPRPGEAPPTPPPPPPAVQLAQMKLQSEQGKQALQQLKVQQENLKLEIEKLKLQEEIAKAQSIKVVSNFDIHEKSEKLRLENERLSLEKEKHYHQKIVDVAKLETDSLKTKDGAMTRMPGNKQTNGEDNGW